ncbi:MAG: hypothetical protein QNL09_05770, partial [Burkholderiaceae bacterium]
MNRKVFITLTLALLTTSAVYSSTDEQTDVHRAALTKQLFKAKLKDAWATGLAIAPDASSRLAKQGMATDGLSTVAAPSGGAVEMNPILGASPSVLGLASFTAAKFMYGDHVNADTSQLAQARANKLCALGDAATSNNMAVLIGASTGLPLLIGAVVANKRYGDCVCAAQTTYLTHVAP